MVWLGAIYSGVRLQGKHLQGNFFEFYNNLGVRLQGKLFAYKGKILRLYSGVRSEKKNFETLQWYSLTREKFWDFIFQFRKKH